MNSDKWFSLERNNAIRTLVDICIHEVVTQSVGTTRKHILEKGESHPYYKCSQCQGDAYCKDYKSATKYFDYGELIKEKNDLFIYRFR